MRRKWICVLTAALLMTGCAEAVSDTADNMPETAAPETAAAETAAVTETASTVTEPEIPAEPIGTSNWTEDDLRNISDDDLILLSMQGREAGYPAFCAQLPFESDTLTLVTARRSAADRAEADQIVAETFSNLLGQDLKLEDPGRWWYYVTGSGLPHHVLVFDAAFFDRQTATLHADVTEENLLLLAAVHCYQAYGYSPGAFVHDTGDSLCCTQYFVSSVGGDWGMSDTAALYAYSFYADKETGVLEGYPFDGLPNPRAELIKELEIPGTYHAYPE